MKAILLVGLGGFLGANARFLINTFFDLYLVHNGHLALLFASSRASAVFPVLGQPRVRKAHHVLFRCLGPQRDPDRPRGDLI